MKKHIMKLVAVVMTAIMVMSLVPVAALPEVNWPELLSVFGASSDVAVEEAGDVSTTDTAATTTTTAPVSELTPADTDGFYTDDAGNVYVDTDGDGVAEAVQADTVVDDEDYDIADLIGTVEQGKVVDNTEYNADANTVSTGTADTYLPWSDAYEALGASNVNGYTADASGNLVHLADKDTSAYEPWVTKDEDHPFLPQGDAWINLERIFYGAPATPTFPFTKWSANTTFMTSSTEYDEAGNITGWVFPDIDLIDESVWKDTNYQNTFKADGVAYNRYDAQQDKWGITFDRNVNNEYVEWSVGKTVDLAENPYLLYSTEQIDGQQMAIAIKIGTQDTNGNYVYRWYTVTDSITRPDINGGDSYNNSMEPNVKISAAGAAAPVLADADGAEVMVGSAETIVADTGYVDGAICACIDMVQWLPLSNAMTYHIDSVRVYTQATGEKQAARINYLYFFNQASNFLVPMSDTGTIDVSNEGKAATYGTVTHDGLTTYNNGWINAAAIVKQNMNVHSTYNMVIDTSDAAAKGLDTFTKDGNEYVLVSIPVRKWSNVVWDARKLLIKFNSLETPCYPAITILGGSTGQTNSKIDSNGFNNDASNESILGVFGGMNNGSVVTPYTVQGHMAGDSLTPYASAQAYNGDASWYDWLENGQVDDFITTQSVTSTDGTVTANASYGWVYISAVHIVLPVNAKMTIYSFDTKNQSDALNYADNTLDGGSGVQPQVDVTNGYSYVEEPAAYGPYIDGSTYKSVDLLVRESGTIVGGVPYKFIQDNKGIFDTPARLQADTALKRFSTGDVVNILGIADGSDTQLAAALYDNGDGTYQIGWIVYKQSSGTYNLSLAGPADDVNNLLFTSSNNSHWSYTKTSAFTNYEQCEQDIINALSGNLVFTDGASDGTTPTIGTINGTTVVIPKSSSAWHASANAYYPRRYTSLSLDRGTDVKIFCNHWFKDDSSQESVAAQSHYYQKMAQLLPEPVTVSTTAFENDGADNKGPYLYYDIEYTAGASHLALLIKVNGNIQLAYLDVSGNTINSTYKSDINGHNKQGYIDLKSFITGLGVTEIQVIGYWMQDWYQGYKYSQTATTHTNIIRRLEIRYREEQYRDVIVMDKTDSNKMVDKVSIIDDAMGYTLSDSNTKVVENVYGDKGWCLQDIPDDYNPYQSGSETLYPVYYQQLGHLRVKVASATSADFYDRILFSSKGSFSVSDYRYLYISAAMVDAVNGIAAEDQEGAGIAVRINQTKNSADSYFVTENGGLTDLLASSGNYTNFLNGSLNVALDLQALGKFDSFNQIVFHFVNTTGSATDFYINYCYLSNTAPTQEYITEIERPYYQTYYLMDNTGDRYSTRFPTTTNPTGQITTVTGNTGRVNPMIVKRGARFYEGKFFNGVAVSDGVGGTASLMQNWFYEYDTIAGYNNVSDYYYRSGYGDEGDMLWSYGRWGNENSNNLLYDDSAKTVTGEMLYLYATANNVLLRSGLEPVKYRTIYDTQGGQMVYGDYSYSINTGTNGVYENLNNIYNTETVVLSYYTWPTTGGLTLNPVKYGYTFEGWFDRPQEEGESASETDVTPIYRYNKKPNPDTETFYAWWSQNSGTDPVSKEDWATLANTVTFLRQDGTEWIEWFDRAGTQANDFTVKLPNVTSIVQGSTTEVFAGWLAVPKGEKKPALTADTHLYTSGTTITVTTDYDFYPVTLNEWNEATGSAESVNKPHTIKVVGGTLWACRASDKEWFEITEESLPGVTVTTSTNTTNDGIENGTAISQTIRTYTNIPHFAMLQVCKDADRQTVDGVAYCWVAGYNSTASAYSVVNTGNNTSVLYSSTLACYEDTYQFSAYADISLTYQTRGLAGSWDNHEMKDANGAFVWTAPEAYVQNRQIMFTSQYDLPDGATFVECGTLYTKSTQFDAIAGSAVSGLTAGTSAYNKAVANALGNAMRFVDADGAALQGDITDITRTLPTTVRSKVASATNESNQYYLMVTVNKTSAATYYARGYVIYELGGTTYVTYSDIISVATLTAIA